MGFSNYCRNGSNYVSSPNTNDPSNLTIKKNRILENCLFCNFSYGFSADAQQTRRLEHSKDCFD